MAGEPAGGCSLIAYTGMAFAPGGAIAWLWMVLAGIGSGIFPVALTMIGLRARNAGSTAALSSFVQAIGYLVAGTGPLLFGVLYGSTQHWALPLVLLFAALVLSYAAGMVASRERFIDDELAARFHLADL
jgi:MFS transporter, CP family, cyanate transporter